MKFIDLKKGDTIYFYRRDDINYSEIDSYVLEEEPIHTNSELFEDVIYVDFTIPGSASMVIFDDEDVCLTGDEEIDEFNDITYGLDKDALQKQLISDIKNDIECREIDIVELKKQLKEYESI